MNPDSTMTHSPRSPDTIADEPFVVSTRALVALRATIVVFVAVAAYNELYVVAGATGIRAVAVVALLLVYGLNGVLGTTSFPTNPSATRRWLFFGGQLAVTNTLVTIATDTTAINLLFPLLAQAGFHLPSIRARTAVFAAVGTSVLIGARIHGVPYEKVSSFLIGCFFVVLMARLMVKNLSERRRAEHLSERLAETNAQLEILLGQAEQVAAASERARIARDIHDSIGHCLTSAHVHLQVVERVLEPDHSAADAVTQARTFTHTGLQELREAVTTLREPSQPLRPLDEAIADMVDGTAAPPAITFEVEGASRPLEGGTRYALFRAAQEAINNVVRHADAESARIRLGFVDPQRVVLRVDDDGWGSAGTGAGFGLVGMNERVADVGGRVTMDTAPGKGFSLRVEVPG